MKGVSNWASETAIQRGDFFHSLFVFHPPQNIYSKHRGLETLGKFFSKEGFFFWELVFVFF